jgi:hypothetical protein
MPLKAACCMVFPAKCKKSSANQFLFWNAVGALMCSTIAPFIGIEMRWISKPHEMGNSCYQEDRIRNRHLFFALILDSMMWLLTATAGIFTIITNQMLIVANQMTPPTIVAMVMLQNLQYSKKTDDFLVISDSKKRDCVGHHFGRTHIPDYADIHRHFGIR